MKTMKIHGRSKSWTECLCLVRCLNLGHIWTFRMKWVGRALSSSFVSTTSRAPFQERADADRRSVQGRCLRIQYYQKYLSHLASTYCKRHLRTMRSSSLLLLKSSRPSPNLLLLKLARRLAMRAYKLYSCVWSYVTDCLNGFNGCAVLDYSTERIY